MDKATRAQVRALFTGLEFKRVGVTVYEVTLRGKATGKAYSIAHRVSANGPYPYHVCMGQCVSFDEAIATVLYHEQRLTDRMYADAGRAFDATFEDGGALAWREREVLAGRMARIDAVRCEFAKL